MPKLSFDRKKKVWVLSAPPHILMRAKRVFGKANQGAAKFITLSDTPENARDLEWFLSRYEPYELTDPDLLREKAQVHIEKEALVHKFLSNPQPTRNYELAIPAREYQKAAAELFLTTNGLLLADSLGTGKTISAIAALCDGRTLPALVVTMTSLPGQWESQINRFLPALKTVILKKGTPYDLTKVVAKKYKCDPTFPDVIITNYHKLHGWGHTLSESGIQTVIYDEVQELRSGPGTNKYQAAELISQSVTFREGLSVGPESYVEMRGGVFGKGWLGPIEKAHTLASTVAPVSYEAGYEIVAANEVESRGWVGDGFHWKPVRNFIKHKCDQDVVEIFAGGAHTTMTVDHSVFVVRSDGLLEVRASDLKKEDIIPVDNGANWSTNEEVPLDIIEIANTWGYRSQVIVDTTALTRKDIGVTAWQWQNFHSEGKYGRRLPSDLYLKFKHLLPQPTGVYLGCGKAAWLPTQVYLSKWAYVLGFFLGDGWVNGNNRIAFAVESDRKEDFIRELDNLAIGLRPSVRQMAGKSIEVRCSHKLFAIVLDLVFHKKKCHEKFIPPEWIMTWGEEARRELLRGIIDSDGHIAKTGKSITYTTTSPALAKGVVSLLRSLGVYSTQSSSAPKPGGRINGRQIVGKKKKLSVHWSPFALHQVSVPHSGHRIQHDWARGQMNQGIVRSIKTHTEVQEVPLYVYDLEMEGHPSFVANGILVHNSATPIHNYGGEFYHVLSVLFPGSLGTYEEFVREWCRTSYNDKPKLAAPKDFREYLISSGMMLQRTRKDIGRELPKLQRIDVPIEANPEALTKVEDACVELARIILGEKEVQKGAKMLAAEELSNKLRQATGIAKCMGGAAEFIRMLAESGEKILVFAWHRECYSILNSKLADFKPVMYTGSESPKQKEDSKKAFCEGDAQIMFMSLRSGAGLDGLQYACSTVVFVEYDWAYAVLEQGEARIYRDGQENPVVTYFLTTDAGSDPAMIEVLGLKRNQLEGVMMHADETKSLEKLEVDPDHIKKLAASYLAGKKAYIQPPS